MSGGPAVWAALPGERGPAGTHSSTAGLAGGPGGQGTCWLLEAVCCTEDTDPEASLDPETPSPSKCSMFQKISVLEERAVSGKRAVPDKASDSEKRSVSEKATVFEKTPVPEMQPAPSGPWPQCGPRTGSTQPQQSARPAPGGSGALGLRRSPSLRRGLCPRLAASRLSLCRCTVPPTSLSSRHLWRPPCLLSSHLLSSPCLWLPPFSLSSSLQARPSSVSPLLPPSCS